MYELSFPKLELLVKQSKQIDDGTIDPLIGDLSYQATAWLGYLNLWAPACPFVSRSGKFCYHRDDFTPGDGMHPAVPPVSAPRSVGIGRIVEQELLPFFLKSQYTTWFRAK
jgi:hypothetical protein